MLSLRIREGVYIKKGFGLLPKIVIWGMIGVVIASAMIIFRTGTVRLLDGGFHLGGKASEWFEVKNGVIPPLTWGKVFVALCVSTLMNTLFAPIFITFHKITDIHIEETGGTLKGFFSSPLNICEALSKKINWEIHYGFVIAKTIPFYAIPANTIVFLLPPTLQVLAAALVGVSLGLVLSIKK